METVKKILCNCHFRMDLNSFNLVVDTTVFAYPHTPDRFTPHMPVAQKIADQR